MTDYLVARLCRGLRRFAKDTIGAGLILFTVMAPVTIGIVGLAVDASRFMMLNTELQDMADAAALAAAARLRGTATSMDEAIAAGDAVLNDPKWSNAPLVSGAVTRSYVFTDALGPLTFAASDQKKAAFVKVTTTPRTFTGALIAALTPSKTLTTSARATAGSTVIACKVPPLMICAPGGNVANLPYSLQKGMLYRLKGGGGAGYDNVPGAFGLLDTPGRTSTGTNEIRDNLAEDDPNFCFLSQMSRRNGNAAAIQAGINVRFDMYTNQVEGNPPAPNRTSRYVWNGRTGNACGYDLDASKVGLSNGVAETQDAAMGPGSTWTSAQRTQYWNANHAAKGIMPTALASATRFEMYLWELSLHPTYPNAAYPAQMPNEAVASGSVPNPPCWGQSVPSTNANRRVIYAAVLDCSGSQAQISIGTQYLKFFISEPATQQGDVFAEYIGIEELGGSSGVLHHIVQLYR